MVEQAHAGEGHDHAEPVTGLDHLAVPDAAAGLSHVGDAAAAGALDVVPEGEERVAAETRSGDPGQMGSLLLTGEGKGAFREQRLPDAVRQKVLAVFSQVQVDRIVALGAADVFQEGKLQNTRCLAQEPVVRLAPRQTGAVDAALLTGTDADRLPVIAEAHGIGLSIFQSDKADDQVADGRLRQILF